MNDLSVGEVRMKAFRQINFLSSDFTLQVSNARSSYKTYLTICLWGGGWSFHSNVAFHLLIKATKSEYRYKTTALIEIATDH